MKTLIFISLMIYAQLSFSQIDRKGNGGNEIALDFLNSAKQVLSNYSSELKTFPILENIDLGNVLDNTQILISMDPLIVNLEGVNQVVTAVNFKNPPTIVINEKRWQGIKDLFVKEALALHELLGLVGVEKTGDYFISKNYLNKNGVRCKTGLCDSESESQKRYYPSYSRPNIQVVVGDKSIQVKNMDTGSTLLTCSDFFKSYCLF